MKKSKTQRGFDIYEFEDSYNEKCSLQKSSAADCDQIWLGLSKAEPRILASDAKKLGITTSAKSGWVNYDFPEQVLIGTRMHLTREQVSELIPILQKFVDTGDI